MMELLNWLVALIVGGVLGWCVRDMSKWIRRKPPTIPNGNRTVSLVVRYKASDCVQGFDIHTTVADVADVVDMLQNNCIDQFRASAMGKEGSPRVIEFNQSGYDYPFPIVVRLSEVAAMEIVIRE